MHRRTTRLALAVALTAMMLTGCSPVGDPYVSSRTTLGTAVTVTAYGDRTAAELAVEQAFDAMDAISASLDAYTPDTPVARFNADPAKETPLPGDALVILDAIDRLGVGDDFSVALFGVSALYGFESAETVPTAADLSDALAEARSLTRNGDAVRFADVRREDLPLPGLDFGGAAKGLGLDSALTALTDGGVEAAVASAGSTTVTLGTKPDGEPWRVGIEDPRDTGRVIAVVEAEVPCAVSTSGDYQRYFELDGVRYHHILDPVTGMPARGLRSLTVFAAAESLSGLDADILSTALFVMGPEAAESYALEHNLGLYMVDDEGRALVVPAPEDSGVRLVTEAEPIR